MLWLTMCLFCIMHSYSLYQSLMMTKTLNYCKRIPWLYMYIIKANRCSLKSFVSFFYTHYIISCSISLRLSDRRLTKLTFYIVGMFFLRYKFVVLFLFLFLTRLHLCFLRFNKFVVRALQVIPWRVSSYPNGLKCLTSWRATWPRLGIDSGAYVGISHPRNVVRY